MKKQVVADKGPAAIGPYSHAIESGNFLFCSGQIPVDKVTGKVNGDIQVQTRQVFRNIEVVLDAAGMTLANVVKCQVFLTNMADFAAMNAVYEEFFKPHGAYPARTALQVAALPLGVSIEIDVIASRA